MSWWVCCKLDMLSSMLLVAGRRSASPRAGAPRCYIGLALWPSALSVLRLRIMQMLAEAALHGPLLAAGWCPHHRALSMPQAATTDLPHIKTDSPQPVCRSRSVTGDMWVRKTVAVPHGRCQALAISICCRRGVGCRLCSAAGAAPCSLFCRACTHQALNLQSYKKAAFAPVTATVSSFTAAHLIQDACVLATCQHNLHRRGHC